MVIIRGRLIAKRQMVSSTRCPSSILANAIIEGYTREKKMEEVKYKEKEDKRKGIRERDFPLFSLIFERIGHRPLWARCPEKKKEKGRNRRKRKIWFQRYSGTLRSGLSLCALD